MGLRVGCGLQLLPQLLLQLLRHVSLPAGRTAVPNLSCRVRACRMGRAASIADSVCRWRCMPFHLPIRMVRRRSSSWRRQSRHRSAARRHHSTRFIPWRAQTLGHSLVSTTVQRSMY